MVVLTWILLISSASCSAPFKRCKIFPPPEINTKNSTALAIVKTPSEKARDKIVITTPTKMEITKLFIHFGITFLSIPVNSQIKIAP